MVHLSQHDLPPRELLLRRLEALTGRPVAGRHERIALDGPRRRIGAGGDVLSEQAHGAEALVIVSGVAADARILPDGRRQLLSLRLPGDILQGDAQDGVSALTEVEVVDAAPILRDLGEPGGPLTGLGRAWLTGLRADQAMLRDQIVRLGRLSAYERLAHLLLETHERLFHVGLANAAAFHFPLRQEMIADLLGLSIVHVSRTSQQLRRDRLVQIRSSQVTLLDRERLVAVANYVSRFAAEPKAAPRHAERPSRFAVS